VLVHAVFGVGVALHLGPGRGAPGSCALCGHSGFIANEQHTHNAGFVVLSVGILTTLRGHGSFSNSI
jgi:hypothetical protein